MCGGGAEDAPAPKASGWLSAKRELRSSRKGLRDASEAAEDSAPYEAFRPQPVMDAEARLGLA